jgi:hypothetical protein
MTKAPAFVITQGTRNLDRCSFAVGADEVTAWLVVPSVMRATTVNHSNSPPASNAASPG